MNRLAALLISLCMLATAGCKHLGPQTVAVDRFDYGTTIADSWKQQALLNIVKLRYMDLPEAHLKDHSAWPSLENAPAAASRHRGVRIHSTKEMPEAAFATVRYRDNWFWVDNGDLQTKRALTVVMFIFTLAETGSPERLPLITIPAQ